MTFWDVGDGGGGQPARPDDAAEVAPDADEARPLDGNIGAPSPWPCRHRRRQPRHSFAASMPPSQQAAVANQDLAARDAARYALARQCTQLKPAARTIAAQRMLAVALPA